MVYYRNTVHFDGNLRIYPTLACNLHCPYCVNAQTPPILRNRGHRLPDEWARAIEREGRDVVFTGGEPFLYPGFIELLNAVDTRLEVRVYSNFCLDLSKLLPKIRRPAHFYLSWHPQKGAHREQFARNVQLARENKRLGFTAHAINASENKIKIINDIDWFSDKGIKIDLDEDQRDFIGTHATTLRRVSCRRRIFLLGPEGSRYQCVSKLVRGIEPMENIFSGLLQAETNISICNEFGYCAPCDGLGDTRIESIGR